MSRLFFKVERKFKIWFIDILRSNSLSLSQLNKVSLITLHLEKKKWKENTTNYELLLFPKHRLRVEQHPSPLGSAWFGFGLGNRDVGGISFCFLALEALEALCM